MNKYEAALSELHTKDCALTDFVWHLKELSRKYLENREKGDFSKQAIRLIEEERASASAAYGKHFGKKRLQLSDPEPRYPFFKRIFRNLFRKQGSVNKALIASLRSQIAWNDNARIQFDEMERLCRGVQQLLGQFLSHGPASQKSNEGSQSSVHLQEELEILSTPARRIYQSLERASKE